MPSAVSRFGHLGHLLDPSLRHRLYRRRTAIAVAAMFAVVASCVDHGGGASDIGELAALLGTASGANVNPNDLRWEPSSGALSDLVEGRFVLFLGSVEPNGPRDVYRARVRLSPEGRALGVAGLYNLTATPLGDDHALVVSGHQAAYATWAYGKEQSVTALDLSGEGNQSAATRWFDRAMGWVTNAQQTGSGAGVGRIDVTLEQPADRVGLAIVGEDRPLLAIEIADDARSVGPSRRGRLDLARGELLSSDPSMHAEAGKHLPKRFVHWAVDTVRAVPWIGPAPIAWLEEKTFAVKDTVKQTVFKVTQGKDSLAEESETSVPATILDTSLASADLGHWPPPPIRSMWKTPEPGEGVWAPPKQPWIKKLDEVATAGAESPPSPFYETFVRPDEDRPYAKVLLVAMDMRQLDLGMEAGSEDPKPLTGPPGAGRIPRDPHVYKRVAAAFNGGFKTEHGNYGMMLNKRVLLPPLPGAATVVLTKDGHVGMGSWGTNKDVGGINDITAGDILSFRQNLDPLVDNDKVNPQNRGQWGFVLPGTSMQTERSGLCVTNAGHLMYVWGDDTSATSLGKAMKMGGCIYGMHLDMNPHHTGFVYTNINEFKGKAYKSELLAKEMEIDTDRYLLYAPKDFFFMMLHDPRPPAVEGLEWQPDPGAQPAPAWMAGLWRGRFGDVDLLAIEPGRATFRARAGTKEPRDDNDDQSHGQDRDRARQRRTSGAAAEDAAGPDDADSRRTVAKARAAAALRDSQLSEDDVHRVLLALTLGFSESRRSRGLVTDGRRIVDGGGDPTVGALVVKEDGALTIAASFAESSQGVANHGDVVELPMLLNDGDIVAPVVAAEGTERTALGITPAGRVYLARGARIAEVASALKQMGCSRAVVLSRGNGDRGTVFRAGSGNPPRSHYEETTLYAMSKPLLPRGFRFEATNPVEPPTPAKKK